MWLLNHGTLRRFEGDELRRAGVRTIFGPKRFPYDEGNLSASVDATFDQSAGIEPADLAVLNAQDWYDCDDAEAWQIANRYFGIAFIGFFPRQIETVLRHFHGAIVIRVFGLADGVSYSALMREHLSLATRIRLREQGHRVWFGIAYDHLADGEERFFHDRACYLPVGLSGADRSAEWRGDDAKVFFVCPRIGSSPYFRAIYERFKASFGDLPHVIGGAQPIDVADRHVIGYVPADAHDRNMRDLRVMYYHSREPTHVHYHPFEAIQRGMPLVYMGGGLLDKFGGGELPGRCRDERDAHRKLARIVAGDAGLIEAIRSTQRQLLEPMLPQICSPAWQSGFERIVAAAREASAGAPLRGNRRTRIAVIVPVGYRGGSLRGAKLVAEALAIGSRDAGEPADVILAHLDDPAVYTEREFRDLPADIGRRPFRWKTLPRDDARRALAYAGVDGDLDAPAYALPDDGAAQFSDCDLWVLVSDRLSIPLLPIKPYVMMVYDYLQRYERFLDPGMNRAFLAAQHAAERVLVTTRFTERDALDYAGLSTRRLRRMPMLVPGFEAETNTSVRESEPPPPYFIWTTNLALHKNHENAALALSIYYDELDGTHDCKVTGVESDRLLTADMPHLANLKSHRASSRA
jgi:hypothetical protein